jgi:hypothetical protein
MYRYVEPRLGKMVQLLWAILGCTPFQPSLFLFLIFMYLPFFPNSFYLPIFLLIGVRPLVCGFKGIASRGGHF